MHIWNNSNEEFITTYYSEMERMRKFVEKLLVNYKIYKIDKKDQEDKSNHRKA